MSEAATLSIAEHLASVFLDNEVSEACQTLAALAECVPPLAKPHDDDLFRELNDLLHRFLDDCRMMDGVLGRDDELRHETRLGVLDALEPWLEQGWLLWRAVANPRQSHDVVDLLNAVAAGEVKSRGFGGYLDRFFLAPETQLAFRHFFWGVSHEPAWRNSVVRGGRPLHKGRERFRWLFSREFDEFFIPEPVTYENRLF